MIQITTQRLLLRDFAETDLDALHSFASDPEVTRYTSFGPNGLEQTKAFLNLAVGQSNDPRRSAYDFAVQLKESNETIGSCGFGAANHGQYELGYVLAKPYWGRGLATELVTALTRFAFKTLRAQRIWAPVDAKNYGSCRVLEKAGFQLEGLLRQDRLKWPEGRDTKIFGILSEDWNTRS